MTSNQIILEINKMPLIEKFRLIELTIKSIKKETNKKLNLKEASKLLLNDYLNDSELTAFSALDYQDFYETKCNLVK